MRIFVTGASGWIGSAVVPELIGAGHQVLGLARSDASAKAVADLGAEVLRGDMKDPAVLRAGALDSDGVIHLAYEHALARSAGAQTDARAIETFIGSLAGSGKPMVISGATIAVPGRIATERDELIAQGPIAARIRNMQTALAASARDIRSCRGHAAPLGARPGRTSRLRPPAHRQGPRQGRLRLHRRRGQPLARRPRQGRRGPLPAGRRAGPRGRGAQRRRR